MTNAWRGRNRAGAATQRSEAIAFTFDDEPLPKEATEDELLFPIAPDLSGPGCRWSFKPKQCMIRRDLLELNQQNAVVPLMNWSVSFSDWSHSRSLYGCEEREIPRSTVKTLPIYAPATDSARPSTSIVPSSMPTKGPAKTPSVWPTKAPLRVCGQLWPLLWKLPLVVLSFLRSK